MSHVHAMCVEGERLVINVHVIITVLLCGMGTKAQIHTLEKKWQDEQSAIDHMTPVCKCHDITQYHFLLLILQYLEADRPCMHTTLIWVKTLTVN